MRILIVGGTGFIGYHTALECLRRGHSVTALALPPLPADDLLPPQVDIKLANLNTLSDVEVRALLHGHEAVVYAAGADDRVTPRAPAYRFFYEENVRAAARFFRLARAAGVRRGVLLSSYFATFDRMWPEMELAKHHPYIWSRVAQAEQSLNAAAPTLDLMILELGYIFGRMPGRIPIWKPLIDYLRSPLPLFYPQGGTNMIAVSHVAEAIVGALERGAGGERYPIGDENLPWVEWLSRLTALLGKPKRVITIPAAFARLGARFLVLSHRRQGRESGLNPVKFIDVQIRNTFFDPTPSCEVLGYGRGGLDEALAQTVGACLGS
ncbi:MAG TPA: NAD(P)H-binding protein [Anaerolineae bacterium]|nr:NAD(P)H-binding protein [Anaerolineae bacterium]